MQYAQVCILLRRRCGANNSHRPRGVQDEDEAITKVAILPRELNRIQWFLWHGNVLRANDTLTKLIADIDGAR